LVSYLGCEEERDLLTHEDARFGEGFDLLLWKEREDDGLALPVYTLIVEKDVEASSFILFFGYLVVLLRL
jgi:hypothetical protein